MASGLKFIVLNVEFLRGGSFVSPSCQSPFHVDGESLSLLNLPIDHHDCVVPNIPPVPPNALAVLWETQQDVSNSCSDYLLSFVVDYQTDTSVV